MENYNTINIKYYGVNAYIFGSGVWLKRHEMNGRIIQIIISVLLMLFLTIKAEKCVQSLVKISGIHRLTTSYDTPKGSPSVLCLCILFIAVVRVC